MKGMARYMMGNQFLMVRQRRETRAQSNDVVEK
jgi:hypothetical protein